MPPPVASAAEPVHQNVFSRRKQFWIELSLRLVGLSSPVPTWWYQSRLTFLQQVAVWGVLLLILAVLSRRGWVKLFGPVLIYDAIRTGRRSRYIVLRCLYASAFLLVLYWTYTSYVNSPPRFWGPGVPRSPVVRQSEAAALAAAFFYSFMKLQFLALVFFIPAYPPPAIAQAKHLKTIHLLLSPHLHNLEIPP